MTKPRTIQRTRFNVTTGRPAGKHPKLLVSQEGGSPTLDELSLLPGDEPLPREAEGMPLTTRGMGRNDFILQAEQRREEAQPLRADSKEGKG